MDGFLSNWLQALLQENQQVTYVSSNRCPKCGMSWVDFRQKGRLGCSECYETFTKELQPIINQLQGSLEHKGKIPVQQGKEIAIQRKITILRNDLQRMVNEQNFEEAARIRDQIREMEKGEN